MNLRGPYNDETHARLVEHTKTRLQAVKDEMGARRLMHPFNGPVSAAKLARDWDAALAEHQARGEPINQTRNVRQINRRK